MGRKILLAVSFTVALLLAMPLFSLAQKNILLREKHHSFSTYLLHPFRGEFSVSYEHFITKKYNLEYSLGYIYKEMYWKDIGYTDHSFVYTPSTGLVVRLFLKKYDSDYLDGFYHGPTLISKYIHMPFVEKLYRQSGDMDVNSMNHSDGAEFDFEDKVCDYCITKENINKIVVSAQYIVGGQGFLTKNVFYNIYTGLGGSVKVINSSIKELYDQNIYHTFYFENYRIRYFIFLPSF